MSKELFNKSLILLFIELIKLFMCLIFILLVCFKIVTIKSFLFSTQIFPNFLFNKLQTFSIGFKSGLLAGPSGCLGGVYRRALTNTLLQFYYLKNNYTFLLKCAQRSCIILLKY